MYIVYVWKLLNVAHWPMTFSPIERYLQMLYLFRWFHKNCTQMKRISTKFSCRSVKMECLVISITNDKPSDEEEILL